MQQQQQRTYATCLQFPLAKLVLTLITILTQYYDVYCENNWAPKFAHLWLTLADWLFIGGALGASMSFGGRLMREKLVPAAHHRMHLKTYSLAAFVLMQYIQDVSDRPQPGLLNKNRWKV